MSSETERSERYRMPSPELSILSQALRHTGWTKDATIWMKAFSKGFIEACASLMVLLLPNLEAINYAYDDIQFLQLTAKNAFSRHKPISFQNLRSVNLRFQNWNDDAAEYFACFYQFSSFPAMESISGYTVNSLGPLEWPSPSPISNITQACFDHSCITGRDLNELFRRTPNLMHFIYTHHDLEGSDSLVLGELDEALQHLRHQLRQLTLIVDVHALDLDQRHEDDEDEHDRNEDEMDDDDNAEDIEDVPIKDMPMIRDESSSPIDLSDFEVLETLHISWPLLRSPIDGQFKLQDSLPNSLEDLTLAAGDGYDFQEVHEDILHMLPDTVRGLPVLRRLALDVDVESKALGNIRQAYWNAGVELITRT